MKSLLNTFLIAFAFSSFCFCETDEDLVEIVNKAFLERDKAGGLTNKEDVVKAFSREFQDLEDSQKLKALALYLYEIDRSDSKWSMSSSILMGIFYALADDPDFVSNWSSLRDMLSSEKNPRKFYLLSQIASMAKSPNDDFVTPRTHMLFADGRVAKEEGEYTKDYAHDVSIYAYSAIVANLQSLGAKFAPPPANLPHGEQAVILAKWLKENWPGCENLEIPDESKYVKDPANNTSMDTREKLRKPLTTGRSPEVGENGAFRYLLVGVAALLALAGAWFGLRRMKLGV